MRLWGLAVSVMVGVQRDILSPVSLAKCLLPGGVTSGVGKAGGRSWAGGWTALILFKQRWLLRTSSFWQGSEWEARGRLCWCLMGWLSYCPVSWMLPTAFEAGGSGPAQGPGLSCAAYSAAQELMQRLSLLWALA